VKKKTWKKVRGVAHSNQTAEKDEWRRRVCIRPKTSEKKTATMTTTTTMAASHLVAVVAVFLSGVACHVEVTLNKCCSVDEAFDIETKTCVPHATSAGAEKILPDIWLSPDERVRHEDEPVFRRERLLSNLFLLRDHEVMYIFLSWYLLVFVSFPHHSSSEPYVLTSYPILQPKQNILLGMCFFIGGGGSATPSASAHQRPSLFPNYSLSCSQHC
jgi:hypothetical protein